LIPDQPVYDGLKRFGVRYVAEYPWRAGETFGAGSHPYTIMTESVLAFWMTLVGTICWGVCFWWMHRLSSKQNSLLDQLREQGRRIEKLSRVEHDLIKEVHPQVNEIKEGMDAMIAVVKEKSENHPPPPAKTKGH
jgi:hypothetical protein